MSHLIVLNSKRSPAGDTCRRISMSLLVMALLGSVAGAGERDVAKMLRGIDTEASSTAAHKQLARADLAALSQILADGTIPLPDVSPDGAAFGTVVSMALTDLQRQSMIDAISATDPRTVRRFLTSEVTPDTSRNMRRTALRVLTPIAALGDLAYG